MPNQHTLPLASPWTGEQASPSSIQPVAPTTETYLDRSWLPPSDSEEDVEVVSVPQQPRLRTVDRFAPNLTPKRLRGQRHPVHESFKEDTRRVKDERLRKTTHRKAPEKGLNKPMGEGYSRESRKEVLLRNAINKTREHRRDLQEQRVERKKRAKQPRALLERTLNNPPGFRAALRAFRDQGTPLPRQYNVPPHLPGWTFKELLLAKESQAGSSDNIRAVGSDKGVLNRMEFIARQPIDKKSGAIANISSKWVFHYGYQPNDKKLPCPGLADRRVENVTRLNRVHNVMSERHLTSLRQLLIQAGDVELNPGWKHSYHATCPIYGIDFTVTLHDHDTCFECPICGFAVDVVRKPFGARHLAVPGLNAFGPHGAAQWIFECGREVPPHLVTATKNIGKLSKSVWDNVVATESRKVNDWTHKLERLPHMRSPTKPYEPIRDMEYADTVQERQEKEVAAMMPLPKLEDHQVVATAAPVSVESKSTPAPAASAIPGPEPEDLAGLFSEDVPDPGPVPPINLPKREPSIDSTDTTLSADVSIGHIRGPAVHRTYIEDAVARHFYGDPRTIQCTSYIVRPRNKCELLSTMSIPKEMDGETYRPFEVVQVAYDGFKTHSRWLAWLYQRLFLLLTCQTRHLLWFALQLSGIWVSLTLAFCGLFAAFSSLYGAILGIFGLWGAWVFMRKGLKSFLTDPVRYGNQRFCYIPHYVAVCLEAANVNSTQEEMTKIGDRVVKSIGNFPLPAECINWRHNSVIIASASHGDFTDVPGGPSESILDQFSSEEESLSQCHSASSIMAEQPTPTATDMIRSISRSLKKARKRSSDLRPAVLQSVETLEGYLGELRSLLRQSAPTERTPIPSNRGSEKGSTGRHSPSTDVTSVSLETSSGSTSRNTSPRPVRSTSSHGSKQPDIMRLEKMIYGEPTPKIVELSHRENTPGRSSHTQSLSPTRSISSSGGSIHEEIDSKPGRGRSSKPLKEKCTNSSTSSRLSQFLSELRKYANLYKPAPGIMAQIMCHSKSTLYQRLWFHASLNSIHICSSHSSLNASCPICLEFCQAIMTSALDLDAAQRSELVGCLARCVHLSGMASPI